MKRKTVVLSDENSRDLHSGKFGTYTAHEFTLIDSTSYDDHITLNIGSKIWAKLNSTNKVKVTITAVE